MVWHLNPHSRDYLDLGELEKEVREYFKNHEYEGVGSFELQRIEIPKKHFIILNSRLMWAVPEEDAEESITNKDELWEKALSKIGVEYDIDLRLPYWCYEK